jgi:hypothetical protein
LSLSPARPVLQTVQNVQPKRVVSATPKIDKVKQSSHPQTHIQKKSRITQFPRNWEMASHKHTEDPSD